ncbi:GNAT family N-acetyltransferase [Francisellaceae bacterium]|nr:GNAT family N-acetyltransferase [Francisellaceae bacterium]
MAKIIERYIILNEVMVIKQVSLESVIPIRHQILRANKPISECYYAEDKYSNTIHFGKFLDDQLVGIISIYAQDQNLEPSQKEWRIRGMAVLKEYQGQGYGLDLVNLVIEYLRQQNAEMLWCNARTSACPFYEKTGFAKHGEEFDISGIGAHFIMIKNL